MQSDRKQAGDQATALSWQGVEIVDRIIKLVQKPMEELKKEFREQAVKLDLRESQLADERKIVDKYVAKRRLEQASAPPPPPGAGKRPQ